MPKYSSSNPQSRKNRPLKRVSPRWRSTFPISLSQLQRKRDEFWDTAPAAEDYDMAQAILDGACITLPSGTLYDCYDELGAHYQLPLYVLSQPSNLVPDPSTPDSQSLHSQPNIFSVLRNSNTYTSGFNNTRVRSRQQCTDSNNDPSSNDVCGCLSLFNVFCHRNRRNRDGPPHWLQWNFNSCRRDCNQSVRDKIDPTNHNSSSPPSSCLNLRLSTGEQYKLEISDQNITVLEAKRLFTSLCGWHELRQRWFVCGRSLSNRLLIKDCHIPSGFVIQVIVHSPFDPECLWKQGNRSATSSVVEAIIS
uniref:UBD domain-containing protein n=1 Tax=Schistosoma mansoni TaxID=6183 RepID=A0A5K4FAX3_SCHMA